MTQDIDDDQKERSLKDTEKTELTNQAEELSAVKEDVLDKINGLQEISAEIENQTPETATEQQPEPQPCQMCVIRAEESIQLQKQLQNAAGKILKLQNQLERNNQQLNNALYSMTSTSVAEGSPNVNEPDITCGNTGEIDDMNCDGTDDDDDLNDAGGDDSEVDGTDGDSDNGDDDYKHDCDDVYDQLADDDPNAHQPETPMNNAQSVKQEPKVIVFLNQLLLLFQHCHLCFAKGPSLTVKQTGTMVSITSTCKQCGQHFVWRSQPFILGQYPAGNLLLSFAVLCAGGSIKKTLLVFKYMGIRAYQEPTFYYHQRHLLIPSIVKFGHSYQTKTFQSLEGKEVVLAGDGRHDSMGHLAKFGTYTIFCCTAGLILHLVLVQANQAGSSTAMEFLGHKMALTYLVKETSMIITTYITDRHGAIGKWMREICPTLCEENRKTKILE